MKSRPHLPLAMAAVIALSAWSTAFGANPILGEVELKAASKVERSAGVWLDGQYLGHLDELKRKSRLVLVPGEHELLVKLAGYEDLEAPIIVEPGQRHLYRVSMKPDPDAVYPEKAQTASLRISVEPEEAAVFVNGVYAGYVDRFNGRKGLRVGAGVYRVKIALPGYLPFETELTLLADQEYEIKTELKKASITEQPEGLIISQARE
jgi:hypothetical protein